MTGPTVLDYLPAAFALFAVAQGLVVGLLTTIVVVLFLGGRS